MALLEKIRLLTGGDRQPGSPFASPRTAQKWLQNLPRTSDYDAHHVLVEGLERYNGDTRGDAYNRIRILQILEAAGLPLQDRLVAQYLKTHERQDAFRQTLWRECHLFWDQLALAYLSFLNLVLRKGGAGKLAPLTTEIAVKSLRYVASVMRWEYLRGRRPAESAWRRLHKIYRAVENASLVVEEVEIGGRLTSCAREYVRTLLYDLANPYAFGAGEIELALEILDGLKALPVPEAALRHGRHSHMIDLSAASGPESIDDRWVPGGRLRYLDLRVVLSELEQRAGAAPDTPQATVCRKLARVIGRPGSNRGGPRRPRFGEVRAVFGADAVLAALSAKPEAPAAGEYLTLRDESSKGLGFVLNDERELPAGSLLAIERDEGVGSWQLLAVRWTAAEGIQWLLGTEILSRFPKRVELEWQGEVGPKRAMALFLPLASASQGATSNLLLPAEAYAPGRELLFSQDDGTRYRLRLGAVVEAHENWLRVGFDVLAREAA